MNHLNKVILASSCASWRISQNASPPQFCAYYVNPQSVNMLHGHNLVLRFKNKKNKKQIITFIYISASESRSVPCSWAFSADGFTSAYVERINLCSWWKTCFLINSCSRDDNTSDFCCVSGAGWFHALFTSSTPCSETHGEFIRHTHTHTHTHTLSPSCAFKSHNCSVNTQHSCDLTDGVCSTLSR